MIDIAKEMSKRRYVAKQVEWKGELGDGSPDNMRADCVAPILIPGRAIPAWTGPAHA